MAFSSKTVIWFLSKELHLPPIAVFPSVVTIPVHWHLSGLYSQLVYIAMIGLHF